MEFELTRTDKIDLLTAINLLIEKEKNRVCYDELLIKLGLKDFEY